MAEPAVGTSLGQNPFKIQETFTWEDLRHGLGRSAEQARHSWEINGIPKNGEAHFFELQMNAFENQGGFSMALSVRLFPYDYLAFSETVSLRAVEARDLALLAMAYLDGLLGESLAKRSIRRYGGKILEWLESVEAVYKQEAGNESHQVPKDFSENSERSEC